MRFQQNNYLYNRISHALIGLGIIILLLGILVHYLMRFEGLLYLEVGHSEDILVRPAVGDDQTITTLTPHHAGRPLGEIPFNLGEAARAFYPQGVYDYHQLPFRIRLNTLELLEAADTQYRIVARPREADREVESHAIAPGDTFQLRERPWQVEAIRPWIGLMHHANGPPMANVSLHLEGELWKDIFLHEDQWLLGNGPTALYFGWFASEEAARNALPDAPPGPESGRWGVRDEPGIHWVHSFLPGNGITLNDGTEVTLLDFDETFKAPPDAAYKAEFAYEDYDGPAMLVQIDQDEVAIRRLITPEGLMHTEHNAATTPEDLENTPEILLEYPAAAEHKIYIHGWRDGAAWGKVFHGADETVSARLEESAQLEDSTLCWKEGASLRLEQLFAYALPVDAREDVLLEAVIAREDQRHRLREGEWMRVGTEHLQFVAQEEAARKKQLFTFYVPGEDLRHELSLEPGGAIQYGGWRFRPSNEAIDAPNGVLLEVKRRPSGPLWIKGLLLLTVGFLGQGFLWYRKRHLQEQQDK